MDDTQTQPQDDFYSPSSADPTMVLDPGDQPSFGGQHFVAVTVDEPAALAADEPVASDEASVTPSDDVSSVDPLNNLLQPSGWSPTGGDGAFGGGQAHEPSEKPAQEPNAAMTKLAIIARALKSIESNLANVIKLIEEDTTVNGGELLSSVAAMRELSETDLPNFRRDDGRVVEGVFDGSQMVGADGKTYTVPANYASKSKLVEGDLLKLTITPKGSFIYKQIGPIERSRLIGALGYDQTLGEFYVTTDNKRWGVIKASVTYFKGEPGDEAVILVPKNAPSKWAAVENVIKKGYLG